MIWSTEDQYNLLCYFTGNTEQKNKVFNKLYNPLINIIDTVCYKTNAGYYNYNRYDTRQEIIINLISTTLPNLKIEKIKGALQYLYTSIRNTYINILKGKKNNYVSIDDHFIEENENNNEYNEKEIKEKIIETINDKIRKEKYINRSTTLLLFHLRDYLLNNNFDERGFRDYVIDKMTISYNTYLQLASILKIKTILFKINPE